MIHPLWYLCLSIRLFLAFSLSKYPKYLKIVLLVIGLGFAYKALTGSNNEVQIEKVFWHETRFVHSFFYLLAYSISSIKNSTKVLILDVVFSIIYRIYYETNLNIQTK